jgi:hypothetical protein
MSVPPGYVLLVMVAVVVLFAALVAVVSPRDTERRTSSRSRRGAGRVVVGQCEQCGRPLRTRRTQIERTLHLTCKCGFHNLVIPEGARRPQPKPSHHVDLRSSRDLELERRAHSPLGGPDGGIARHLCILTEKLQKEGDPADREIKRIGQELFDAGGETRMILVCNRVRALGGAARTLEMYWGGIGTWQG